MVKNKRGWIRIVEATIAIVLILGTIIIINQSKKINSESDLTEKIPPILDEISKNISLRDKIVRYYVSQPVTVEEENFNKGVINELSISVSNLIDGTLIGHDLRICLPQEICSLEEYPSTARGDVYAGERIISSTLDLYSPKKIKLFLWAK